MPVHEDLDLHKLPSEVSRLKQAGMTILAIVPTLVEHRPGNVFGFVSRYAVIFEEPDANPR